jgi:hypothetical protein
MMSALLEGTDEAARERIAMTRITAPISMR